LGRVEHSKFHGVLSRDRAGHWFEGVGQGANAIAARLPFRFALFPFSFFLFFTLSEWGEEKDLGILLAVGGVAHDTALQLAFAKNAHGAREGIELVDFILEGDE
jgi:hypothetical protein